MAALVDGERKIRIYGTGKSKKEKNNLTKKHSKFTLGLEGK